MKKTSYAAIDKYGNVQYVLSDMTRSEAYQKLKDININFVELIPVSRWKNWQHEEASLLTQIEVMGCLVCGSKVGPLARQDSNLAYCGCMKCK